MNNPAVVLILITLLGTALVAAVKMILSGHEKRMDERFAETKGRTEETARALALHVKDEEENVYSRLDGIKDSIAELRLAHMESIGRLSERVTKVETKLPNGELTKVLNALSATLERGKA